MSASKGNRGRGGWGNRGGQGMPVAPGAELDSEAMQQTLGRGRLARSRGGNAEDGRRAARAQRHEQQILREMDKANTSASGTGQTSGNAAVCGEASSEFVTGLQSVNQPFDAYVVLDFEATCEENRRIPNPEVIEFPFVIVDPDTLTVVAEFQRYVRPVQQPTLSKFCTTLTGIDQPTVDQSQTFPEVFKEVQRYLFDTAGLGDQPPKRSYCFVTCGDWDLKTMLPTQARLCGNNVSIPLGFKHWCNLKTFMKQIKPPFLFHGRPARITGMPEMLELLGLQLLGHHHSGIDDCRNIARVLIELMKRGAVVRPTFSLQTPLSELAEWRLADIKEDVATTALTPWASLKSDLSPFLPSNPASSPPVAEPATKKTRSEGNHNAASLTGASARPVRAPTVVIDNTRDAVADLLSAQSNSRPVQAGEMKTVSKAMSFLLRHGADKAGIDISVNGFCRLSDLLRYPSLQSRKLAPATVAQIVAGNDKQRFRMVYGQGCGDTVYIAATQGHSLEGVEVDMKTIAKPEDASDVVIHGTNWDAFRTIRKCGYLSVMSRHHIHFAKGFPKESGVISGMRTSASVVLYLDVPKCLEDGIPLLESANGVILTPGVGGTGRLPLQYIFKAIDRESGTKLSMDAG